MGHQTWKANTKDSPHCTKSDACKHNPDSYWEWVPVCAPQWHCGIYQESYQRMNAWEESGRNKSRRRLAPTGETCWWAKLEAQKKVFGSFGKLEDGLFVDVLLTLSAIQKQATVKPCIRVMARGYAESVAQVWDDLNGSNLIYLFIFEHTFPLSKYLQTAGLDIVCAHRMVASTQDMLKSLGRDFECVKKAADTFVNWTNRNPRERWHGLLWIPCCEECMSQQATSGRDCVNRSVWIARLINNPLWPED